MTESLQSLDDATIARMAQRDSSPAVQEELQRRLRYEARHSGTWSSAPPEPIVRPKATFTPRPKPYHRQLRPGRREPLPACPMVDGRESQDGWEVHAPRNDKERFQANVARFSKLNDSELRMIAMQRTSPESKAARYLIEWRLTRMKQ